MVLPGSYKRDELALAPNWHPIGANPVPQLRPTGVRRLPQFDANVLSPYARGVSVRGIQAHLEQLYQVEISPSVISAVTAEAEADTAKAHGEALGKDEILLTKAAYGWPSTEPFFVPQEALEHWRGAKERGVNLQREWMARFATYTKAFPSEAMELGRRWHGDLPAGWEKSLTEFDASNGNVASRAASGTVINSLAVALPELIGGSADLTGSNLTDVKGAPIFSPTQRGGRNFRFGIREHATGSMMKQQCIHVFTHDSIGLGEDGPTHQPVEHLSSLRCIPGLLVLRPADAAETAEA